MPLYLRSYYVYYSPTLPLKWLKRMEGVRNERNDAAWVERVRERLEKGFYDSQAFWRKGETSPNES